MRKAVFAASLVALLALLYAAAGYWLAPRLVRDALVEQAQRRGLELRIAAVRTDPFALQLALDNVRVLARDGVELASAQSAAVDLAWASLWRSSWTVQEARVHQPRIELARGAGGELGWPVLPEERGESARKAVTLQQLTVSEGTLRFVDRSGDAPFELELQALGLEVKGLSTQGAEPAHYRLAARVAAGGTVSSQGRLSLAPFAASGELEAAAVPLSWLWKEARAQLDGSAAYTYDGEHFRLQDVSLEAARFAWSGIELPRVALRSPGLELPPRAPFEVSGKATAGAQGTLSARGTLGVQPLSADLEIALENLALSQAQRWLPKDVAVKIASGALAANGRLRVGERAGFEGAVALRDARFEEPGSGNLLLAWQVLETDHASLRFSPFAVEIGELVAQAPAGRLIIEEDGRVNFSEVLGNSEKQSGRKPLEATVQRLRIENGTLEFADRSLDNEFAVTIGELAGGITGFSTAPGNPARVQLAGRVEKYGSARIRGTINLDQPKSLTNIRASFRNLDLAGLTPYAVKFAGYRIQSGRLSAELRYRVRDGRLVGENELTFEELKLGEKVQRAGARDLPLELVVALLADAQGRINLDIPVSGNLNDPQFDFGGLVARALGNVVGKIVSAPFRALAAVLGEGGMDLDSVRFEPGTVALTPPAEENVAQVAKALAARPQLGVTVQGSYDAGRDLAALRRQTVRRHIAQRAGYEGGAPLDFSDPKVLQAAERLYMERVGNRLEMLKLRDTEPRYARALVEKLAAALPVAPGTGETLARARAETVRAELLAHGVDPSRVRVEAPAVKEAGDEGVPTLLSLNTGGAASAGASAR